MDSPKAPNRLHWLWRLALSLAGITLCLIALELYRNSPKRQRSAEGAGEATWVQDDPTTFCIALLGSGMLSILVAANGRRLLELSADGAKFEGPSDEQLVRDEEASIELRTEVGGLSFPASPQPQRSFERGASEYEVFPAKSTPAVVFAAAAIERPDLLPTLASLQYAFRRTQGKRREWFLRSVQGTVLRVREDRAVNGEAPPQ